MFHGMDPDICMLLEPALGDKSRVFVCNFICRLYFFQLRGYTINATTKTR
jgi:hypothetical protein